MRDVAASARPLSSRSVVGWGAGALSIGASMALMAMMAKPPQLELRWIAMVVGGSGVLLSSAGVLALLAGSSRTQQAGAASVVQLPARSFVPALALALGSALALTLLVNRALAGVVPAPELTLGVGVPALCLGVLWGIYRSACRLGASGDVRGARSPSVEVWFAALGVLLYTPTLGSFGLLDCWEPHYSEVAREMLARRDWISLWWGDQGWFWSKPILDFWLEGLSYSWFGLDHGCLWREQCRMWSMCATGGSTVAGCHGLLGSWPWRWCRCGRRRSRRRNRTRRRTPRQPWRRSASGTAARRAAPRVRCSSRGWQSWGGGPRSRAWAIAWTSS